MKQEVEQMQEDHFGSFQSRKGDFLNKKTEERIFDHSSWTTGFIKLHELFTKIMF